MQRDRNLDTQPEKDVTPARMLSLSMGLVLGCGLIFGALVGALIGHALFTNLFGWGHGILVGAIIGAAVVALGGAALVRAMAGRVREADRLSRS